MKPVDPKLTCGSVASRLARRLSRFTLVALLTAVGFSAGGSSSEAVNVPAGDAASFDAITSLRPEVRLRKLHLVRPDLIQYPLAYDIYC